MRVVKKMRLIVLTSFVVFLSLLIIHARASKLPDTDVAKDFSGYSLLEAIPNTIANVDLLRYLDANIDEDGMDFWSDPTTTDKPVEILIHPDLGELSKSVFKERNMTLKVISENFTEIIEKEKLELAIEELNFIWSLRASSDLGQGEYPFDLFSYNSLRKMNEFITHLSQNTANYNSAPGLKVDLQSIVTT